MDTEPAHALQELIVQRLTELGDGYAPVSLRGLVEQSGGVLDFEHLRAVVRGERSSILTAREAGALAALLDLEFADVLAAAIVLPPL